MSKKYEGPTINGDPVRLNDYVYMVTMGSMVRVVDVASARFTVQLPNGMRQSFPAEPTVNRMSDSPLFYWEDISKISINKGENVMGTFGDYLGLVRKIRGQNRGI